MGYRIWVIISRGEVEESFVVPKKDVHFNLNKYAPPANQPFLLSTTDE